MRVIGFSLYCFCFSSLCGIVTAQTFEFPMRANDLVPGERVSVGPHAGGNLGIQDLAIDPLVMGHVGDNIWHEFEGGPPANLQDAENDDMRIYGKPFYAMASGEVIGCWRLAPDNPRPGVIDPRVLGQPGNNVPPKVIIPGGNHLWIRHDDGTVALYAHAIPDTIPARLCPGKNAALLPASAPASPFVSNPDVDPATFVPEGVPPATATGTIFNGQEVRRPRVRQGEVLGLIGNTGASRRPHLHVHVETGFGSTPSAPVPMRYERGMFGLRVSLGNFLHEADIDNWVPLNGGPVPADSTTLIWPPTTLSREVHRVAMPISDFGRVFDHLADSGFMPEILDCYHVNGEMFFNMVWTAAQGPWSAVVGVDEMGFLSAALQASGLDVDYLDICASPNGSRYTAIFRQVDGAPVVRSSLTAAQHDTLAAQMQASNMAPISVSVASVNGELVHAVVYHPIDIGDWTIATQLRRTANNDQYEAFLDQAFAEFRKPVYVSAYVHDGVQHFVSIVAERPGAGRARHNRSTDNMDSLIENNVFEGFRTRSVAGMDGAANHRHAAVWIDPPAISITGDLNFLNNGGLFLQFPDGRNETRGAANQFDLQ